MTEDTRSLRGLAEEVMTAQDACNLSGLVHAWSRSISRLRVLLGPTDTDAVNQHPINKLWADKVYDLSRASRDISDAYTKVQELIDAE